MTPARSQETQLILAVIIRARNYSLKSGQVACGWSVKDAASPNGVVLEVVAIVAVPHWRCRSAALHTGWSMITTTSR